ncbi:jg1494, partial [Pararge aegeria aegeria]
TEETQDKPQKNDEPNDNCKIT